ncbi:MAG: helix-turn-helix transcriptional regulator [Clostridia bacterium]|nr:helix-turn-helix transcriptional regulator [Clostridia bacterium]
MDYMDWFSKRLTQLRTEKGVSARDMSLSLGQSESYINKIENKRAMPSMSGFFYICEYLNIEPSEFFNSKILSPQKTNEIISAISKLPPNQAEHILNIINDLTQN